MSLINDVLKNLEHRKMPHTMKEGAEPVLKQANAPDGQAERICLRRRLIFWAGILILLVVVSVASFYSYRLIRQRMVETIKSQMKARMGQPMGDRGSVSSNKGPMSGMKDQVAGSQARGPGNLKKTTPMVELANPTLEPSANTPLPPPPDLQGTGSESDKLVDKSAAMAAMAAMAAKGGTADSAGGGEKGALKGAGGGKTPADATPSAAAAAGAATPAIAAGATVPGAAGKTISVPLENLKEATGHNASGANAAGDSAGFSFMESHDPQRESDLQLMRIDEIAKMGRVEQAEALFKKLPAETNPQEKVILEAKLLSYQQKNNEAISVVEKFNQTHIPSADCLGILGELYDAAGRYNDSQMTYQKLVDFWPDNSKWWLGLAISSMHNEQYSLAISSFEHVQAFQEQLTPEVNSYVHLKLRSLTTDHPTYY